MRKTIAYLMVVGLVLMAFSAVSLPVSAVYVGDVTIMVDGTVDPAGAPFLVTGLKYTLTDDIMGTLRIQKSGITLDGAGFTIEGYGTGPGVLAIGLTGLTIKGLNVVNFGNGIVLVNCDSCMVKENTASYCYDSGIYLTGSNGNTLKENKLHDNYWEGIWLEMSSNNVITNNEAWKQREGGIFLWYWSDNNLIKDNHLHENGVGTWGAGIFLARYCDNNIIKNNKATNKNAAGIFLYVLSNNNIVTENTILDCDSLGIILQSHCSGNSITKNTIVKNYRFGMDGIRFLLF